MAMNPHVFREYDIRSGVDEWGETLRWNRLLREHPGACIISELKSTSVPREDVAANGGRAVMWKAGR